MPQPMSDSRPITRPLDRWFAAALAGAAGELALPRRAKAPLIARDLADLGTKITALRFHPAPLRPGAAYALGWLYGVEMAGLGGRMMAKRLAEQLAVGPRCGGAFFDGYGADTHAMWKRLAESLTRRVTSDAQRDAAREGAIDMLAALDDWLSLESLPR